MDDSDKNPLIGSWRPSFLYEYINWKVSLLVFFHASRSCDPQSQNHFPTLLVKCDTPLRFWISLLLLIVWNVSSMCLIQSSFYCQHWLKLMSLWSSNHLMGSKTFWIRPSWQQLLLCWRFSRVEVRERTAFSLVEISSHVCLFGESGVLKSFSPQRQNDARV